MKEHVEKFESILDESVGILAELDAALQKVKDNLPAYEALIDYYYSDEYKLDVERSNSTDVYKDVKCGVLSEDAVFDLMGDAHDLAITMLEMAVRFLK